MPYHLHMGGESRDCDGRYSFGHDIKCPEPDEDGFADFEAVEYALRLCWRPPDEYNDVTITLSRDSQGRINVHGGANTDEGYWSESYVVCDEDDFEEDYSGYRDHTAESMGY